MISIEDNQEEQVIELETGPQLDLLRVWVEDLRKGLLQTQQTLCTSTYVGVKIGEISQGGTGYEEANCCLGLLSHNFPSIKVTMSGYRVYEWKIDQWEVLRMGEPGSWYYEDSTRVNIPAPIAEHIFGEKWVEITNQLIGMNDTRKRSFEFIARWVEIYFGLNK